MMKLLWCSGNTADFESATTGSIPVGSFPSLSSVGLEQRIVVV